MMNSFFDTKKPIFENEKKCFCNRKGVRFHPTEEEIINHFLYHKINGTDSSVDRDIKQIDLLEWDPKDIPGYLRTSSGSDDDNKRWYFFNLPDFKYSNSRRTNRKTKGGFWKVTGKVRVIKVNKEEIGEKRSLVYYEKSCGLKQTKTDWIIDEFQAKSAIPPERNFVLCRLKYKGDEKIGDHDEGIPFPSVRDPIEADAENEEIAQAWMDFKRAVLAEQLLDATRSGSQNQETTQEWMDFKHSLSDEQLPVSILSGNENQEATQVQMDFKHSLSDEQLPVSTCFGNQNQEAIRAWMDFNHSLSDDKLVATTFSGNQNQEATQVQMDFEHSISDEQLLTTTCSGTQNQETAQAQLDFSLNFTDEELMLLRNCFGNQNTALDLQCAWEDDVDVDPIPLADSFLELDDLPYNEEYYAEIPLN